jgi:hypothetical protein
MHVFTPAPEKVARALERFRRDILANNFNISVHANDRIVQRGITFEEIQQCVANGSIGSGRTVEGQIGGSFVYKGLVVMVYAEHGNTAARPNIVTLFRDNEFFSPNIEDLITVRKETEVKVVEREVVKPLDDLSDEEVEKELQRRRERRELVQKEQEAKRIQGLRDERDEIDLKIEKLKERRKAINVELHEAGVEDRKHAARKKCSEEQLAAALSDPERFAHGGTNTTATAKKHGIGVAAFHAYVTNMKEAA